MSRSIVIFSWRFHRFPQERSQHGRLPVMTLIRPDKALSRLENLFSWYVMFLSSNQVAASESEEQLWLLGILREKFSS